MDQPLGKSYGEVVIDVKLTGLDEQLDKARELVDTIKKARSLADDLDNGINSSVTITKDAIVLVVKPSQKEES